jgi:glycosyltransferase involved in cell wall biosynthesis
VNEEQSIGRVVKDIPGDVQWVIVADNGSTDGTARAAREQGARVVAEPRRGYGFACLAGIATLPAEAEIVVFMDGDYSDYPADLRDLVSAMVEHQADLVIGSRVLGERKKVADSTAAIRQLAIDATDSPAVWIFLYDLGPFRAIRADALRRLNMQTAPGWAVEMQAKALQHQMKVVEVPFVIASGSESRSFGNHLGLVKAERDL